MPFKKKVIQLFERKQGKIIRHVAHFLIFIFHIWRTDKPNSFNEETGFPVKFFLVKR